MDYNEQKQFYLNNIDSSDQRYLLFRSPIEIDMSLQGLNRLLVEMQSEKSIMIRIKQASIFASFLLAGLNNYFYQSKVISIISILSNWIREFKYELKGYYTPDRFSKIESLVRIIITICQNCPLSQCDIKDTRIGKNINKFGKNLPDESILKKRCKEIVDKWRILIDTPSPSSVSMEYSTNTDGFVLGKKTTRENLSPNYEKDLLESVNKKNKPNDDVNINVRYGNTTKKTCLKKRKENLSKRMKVQFANDDNLNQVKIFKTTDKPNASAISNDEYMEIQQEAALNPNKYKIEDIRTKEVKMDNLGVKLTEWKHLLSMIKNLNNFWIELKTETKGVTRGSKSIEKNIIEDYCQKTLSATYFNKIPNPKEGICILFPYEDETIPKIENDKVVKSTIESILSKSNQETGTEAIIELFNMIESFKNESMTSDVLNKISAKLEGINEISEEKRLRILMSLSTQLNLKNQTLNQTKQEFKQNIQYMPCLMNNQSSIILPQYTKNNNFFQDFKFEPKNIQNQYEYQPEQFNNHLSHERCSSNSRDKSPPYYSKKHKYFNKHNSNFKRNRNQRDEEPRVQRKETNDHPEFHSSQHLIMTNNNPAFITPFYGASCSANDNPIMPIPKIQQPIILYPINTAIKVQPQSIVIPQTISYVNQEYPCNMPPIYAIIR